MIDYQIYGVCFQSDVELDMPPSQAEPVFELFASKGPWPERDAGGVVQEDCDEWYTLRVHANGSVEMEWRDWLSFWIDPLGKTVRYMVNDATYPKAFEAYVGNFAASACLLMQGEEPLHSTVVSHHGAALGFLGPSGAGKSTISAYFLNMGARLVTDDMLRITTHQNGVYAEPGLPRLKLFEETAMRHLPQAINNGLWNPLSEKYLFDLEDPKQPRQRVPLEALIRLAPPHKGAEDQVVIRRLEGREVFETLTSSTMNCRLQIRDRLRRQFAFATSLVNKLPVYVLHYPRRHDIFPSVMDAIDELVA